LEQAHLQNLNPVELMSGKPEKALGHLGDHYGASQMAPSAISGPEGSVEVGVKKERLWAILQAGLAERFQGAWQKARELPNLKAGPAEQEPEKL
jgi:hypothetical protein